jgi:hypothetical protein
MADNLADSSPLKENPLVNLPIERLQGLINMLSDFLADEVIREYQAGRIDENGNEVHSQDKAG